ncbi:maleate cis-trans isomerase family protein [Williamsia soli]|uniref:maleate cis-trans isomerase family protein n=1 Tax=Williamsia soli TaxID=364929 RepID=UPI001A9FC300|nr:aspartate/glutamate racemase family protein [Williamsia soli]
MSVTIGILYPGSAAEDDYPLVERILGQEVSLPVILTTVGVDAHEVGALLDLGSSDRLIEGAREVAAFSPDAVMWACTSGSFVFGWDGAHQQVAEISEEVGVPAASTSIAFAAACRELGLDRVAIAATYPEEVSSHFAAFLGRAGITVTELVSHDIPTAAMAGRLDHEAVLALTKSNDSPDAQAVLIPDTALHTVAWLPELEEAVGKPVLTANQVTAWYGLKLAGTTVQSDILGSVFRG